MFDFNDLAFAYGQPQVTGLFKASADDFKVDEILGFELTGEGEHQFLRIEKSGLNTEDLVKQVARCVGKPTKAIAYAGLKDRQALTTQWLSIHCPGEAIPDVEKLQGQGWRVLESNRHLKKLKTGAHAGNQFKLILRDISDFDALEERLQLIKLGGVPNYFGLQRFGHNGQNLSKAEEVLLHGKRVKDRFLRGLYYSAARSFLFNRILNRRVAHQTWNRALAGDVMQLAGTHSIFPITIPDESIHTRVAEQDLSSASPLWGRGPELVTLDALLELQAGLSGFETWCESLEKQGLERAYRAHALPVNQLVWQKDETSLMLSFELSGGAYATSVLRELIY